MIKSFFRKTSIPKINHDDFFSFSLFFLIISIFLPIKPFSNTFINLDIISDRTLSFFISIFIILLSLLKKNNHYLLSTKRLIQLFILNFSYNIFIELVIHQSNIFNNYYISYFLNISLFICTLRLINKNKKLISICINTYIFCTFISSLNIIYQSLNTDNKLTRLTFITWNQNEIAIAICIGISFVIYKIINDNLNNKEYLFYSIISAINLIAIIFTGTRSAIISIFTIFILAIFNAIKQKKYYLKTSVFLFNFTIFSSIIIFFNNYFFKLNILRKDGFLILGGRLNIWKQTLNNVLESPIFGKGFIFLDNQLNAAGKFLGLPHNYVLENLYISGIFSCFLTIIIGLLLIMKCKTNQKYNCSNIIIILPIFVSALFLNITQFRLIWFCLAVFISLVDLEKKNFKPVLKK